MVLGIPGLAFWLMFCPWYNLTHLVVRLGESFSCSLSAYGLVLSVGLPVIGVSLLKVLSSELDIDIQVIWLVFGQKYRLRKLG